MGQEPNIFMKLSAFVCALILALLFSSFLTGCATVSQSTGGVPSTVPSVTYSVSGVSTTVVGATINRPAYFRLDNDTNRNNGYVQQVAGSIQGTVLVTFNGVAPGTYYVWGFKDNNSNGIYDSGDAYSIASSTVTVTTANLSSAFTVAMNTVVP